MLGMLQFFYLCRFSVKFQMPLQGDNQTYNWKCNSRNVGDSNKYGVRKWRKHRKVNLQDIVCDNNWFIMWLSSTTTGSLLPERGMKDSSFWRSTGTGDAIFLNSMKFRSSVELKPPSSWVPESFSRSDSNGWNEKWTVDFSNTKLETLRKLLTEPPL